MDLVPPCSPSPDRKAGRSRNFDRYYGAAGKIFCFFLFSKTNESTPQAHLKVRVAFRFSLQNSLDPRGMRQRSPLFFVENRVARTNTRRSLSYNTGIFDQTAERLKHK